MDFGNKNELLITPSSIDEALQIQDKWRSLFYLESQNNLISVQDIKIVAGVDISYSIKFPNLGVCCIVIWDYKSKKILNNLSLEGKIDFSYIPGLLAFREGGLIAQTLKLLSLKPDLLMFDGHGYNHPKRFGEAIHIGYALEVPSIGIAKNMFVGKIKNELHRFQNKSHERGSKIDILDDNELIGYAYYGYNSTKPIYVSSGYRTDLDTAFQIAVQTITNHRLPEPLYLADQISRQKIKIIEKKNQYNQNKKN